MLFLIVLIGFSRTLYLRAWLDVPAIPAYVLLHGVVLTGWFVAVVFQAAFVAIHRTDIHRRLGWIAAGLGVATLILSVGVTFAAVPRQYAGDSSSLPGLSRLFWANLAALLCFGVFLAAAIARRRRPETHKRLMLLAAMSVVQPAMARVRQVWFPDLDGSIFALVWLSLLVGALALHDLRRSGRVHSATLLGGVFFLGSRAVALYLIAPSETGFGLVRGLAN
jgi:hypothetical protein